LMLLEVWYVATAERRGNLRVDLLWWYLARLGRLDILGLQLLLRVEVDLVARVHHRRRVVHLDMDLIGLRVGAAFARTSLRHVLVDRLLLGSMVDLIVGGGLAVSDVHIVVVGHVDWYLNWDLHMHRHLDLHVLP
jgi:hypothetical protein